MSKLCIQVLFAAHCSQLDVEFVLLISHDLRAAMCEDGSLDACLMTPTELGAHGGVTEQFVTVSPHQGPCHRGAVTDEDPYPVKRLRAPFDIDNIGSVEDCNPATGNAIANSGRTEGMDDGKGFKTQTPDRNRISDFHNPRFCDFVIVHRCPCRAGGVDRTVGYAAQTSSVIRMRMGNEDGIRMDAPDMADPILAAIHHESLMLVGNEERAMPPMTTALG